MQNIAKPFQQFCLTAGILREIFFKPSDCGRGRGIADFNRRQVLFFRGTSAELPWARGSGDHVLYPGIIL
jgi:hypothetical protein